MYRKLHKIDELIKAIEIVLSKDRHVFLIDDVELLEKCIQQLKELKEGIILKGEVDDFALTKLVQIINLLDIFFGCSENILEYFNDNN